MDIYNTVVRNLNDPMKAAAAEAELERIASSDQCTVNVMRIIACHSRNPELLSSLLRKTDDGSTLYNLGRNAHSDPSTIDAVASNSSELGKLGVASNISAPIASLEKVAKSTKNTRTKELALRNMDLQRAASELERDCAAARAGMGSYKRGNVTPIHGV